jgi:hypothetical protein
VNNAQIHVHGAVSRLTLLLSRRVCKMPCTTWYTGDFCFPGFYHALMKPDLRISIKDFSRNKTLRVTLTRVPFGQRQFFVRMG